MADEPLEGFSPEEMAMLRPPPEEDGENRTENRTETASKTAQPVDSDPGDEDTSEASASSEEGESGEADAEEPAQQRSVPHKKFNEERLRRQALERQVAENQQWRQTAEQRLQQLDEHAQRQNQPPRREPPKLQEDPAAYIEMMAGEVERLRNQDYQRHQAEQQQRQAMQARAQIDQHFENDVAEAVQEFPDLQEAFTWLGDNRRKELVAAGYSKPQIEQIMDADYANTVASIAQRGASPARFFYEAAKLRGYRQKPKLVGFEHLDRVERGQATSKSLVLGRRHRRQGRPAQPRGFGQDAPGRVRAPPQQGRRQVVQGDDGRLTPMMH